MNPQPTAEPPIRAMVVPVTRLRQNGAIVWCSRTLKAAIIDPGGDAARLLAVNALARPVS